jgi:hypothetical protein
MIMSKRFSISLVARASRWVAEAASELVRLQVGIAVTQAQSLEDLRSKNLRVVLDAERRLALAVESYGELVKEGDVARALACLAELEIPPYASRRQKMVLKYEDPIRTFEVRRMLRRKLERMKQQAARMEEDKVKGRALADLRREIAAFEDLLR